MNFTLDLYNLFSKKYIGIRIPKPMYHYDKRGKHVCNFGFWKFEVQVFIQKT